MAHLGAIRPLEPEEKVVAIRSPAYPSLSLPAAVEMIRRVHRVQQTTVEPTDVILKHMGYSGRSGRSIKSISSLIKYGLLDKAKGGYRVSQRAMAILYPESDSDLRGALAEAARKPDLFRDMFERWAVRPSEDSLRSYLVRAGFNLNAVDNVARAFYATHDLVSGIGGASDSSRPDELDDNSIDEDEMSGTAMPVPSLVPAREANAAAAMKASFDLMARNVTKPVFDFETVRVNTVIDNREDLAELIARLQQLMPMLAEKTEH